jgi:hypothetical protein
MQGNVPEAIMLRCGVRNRGCALCATPVLYYGSFRLHGHRAGRGGCVSALRSPSRSLFPCCGRSVVRLRGRFEGRDRVAGGAPLDGGVPTPGKRCVATGGPGESIGQSISGWRRGCPVRRPFRKPHTAWRPFRTVDGNRPRQVCRKMSEAEEKSGGVFTTGL